MICIALVHISVNQLSAARRNDLKRQPLLAFFMARAAGHVVLHQKNQIKIYLQHMLHKHA